MIRQATITAVLPDDRLRLSFKPNPDETIEVVVERPAAADVKVGSHVDVDWDRERGVTRLLLALSRAPDYDDVDALLPKRITSVPGLTLATVVDQSIYGWIVQYNEGRYQGTRDGVCVKAGVDVQLGDKVLVARAGHFDATIVEGTRHATLVAPDPDNSEPSFDTRVRMALGVNPLASEADVLAAIRDYKMLAECEREILAALGMPETNTVRDVADAVAVLRRELGINENATWSEIVSAVKDTEAAWEVAQRQRADVCKELGIAEGSSFAELLAEATNSVTLVSMQGKAMREAVRDIRQWMGVHGEKIDETDLADDIAALRRELLRCSGAHVRGSRSIIDGLREVAAEAYARAMSRDQLKLGALSDKSIGSYAIGVSTMDKPARVWITLDAIGETSVVMRAMLAAVGNSHRPCDVLLTVRSDAGKLELTLPSSSVPGEDGWS